jgi:GT2 family glycosyltransferase
MKIAVVILHFGKRDTTKKCLQELKKKIENNYVIVVNNTPDDIKDLTTIIPGTILIDNRANLGFAKGVNQGIALALKDKATTAVFLMNNDLSLSEGSFNQLMLVFNKIPTAAIVTPILHHPGGYDWGGKYSKWSGMVRHKNWHNKSKTIQAVQHVAGAAMLISRKTIEKMGLFDERFFLYYEDLDYCLRAYDAVWTIHINPSVVAEHAVSAGSTSFQRLKYQWRSHLQFVTKHLGRHAYPTAYFYDLIVYPLLLLKSLLRG